MKRKQKQNPRGSILAYTLIVLMMMFAIVASMSKVTVLEKNEAISSQASAQAYQVTDSGAQLVMKKITASPSSKISDLYPTCSSGKVVGLTDAGEESAPAGQESYDVFFYTDENGADSIDCSDLASAVKSFKSVGTYKGSVRAIMVTLGTSTTPVLYGTNYGKGKLNIFNVANPVSPAVEKTMDVTSAPYYIAISGNYAYLADYGQASIEILDITDRYNPKRLSNFSTSGKKPIGIVAYRSYLYVSFNGPTSPADYITKIYSINAGNGELTDTTKTFNPGAAYNMAISGHYLYVSNTGAKSVTVFDVTDPQIPSNLYSISLGGQPVDIAPTTDGKYLYVANVGNPQKIEILDISDKTKAPKQIPSADTIDLIGGSPYGVEVYGSTLYVAETGWPQLGVFDITDPKKPVLKNNVTIDADQLGLVLAE